MSWEDIPPAPKPFDMNTRQQDQPSQFSMPEFSKLNEGVDDVEIPSVPDIGAEDIEKTILPAPAAPPKSNDGRFFEDIPFPGVGKRDFAVPGKTDLPAPKAFDMPQPAMPKPEAEPVPPPQEKPEIVIEPPKPVAPAPKIAVPPRDHDDEYSGELGYLKERVNVDFGRPLFLNLEQCETIIDAANDMRKGLADYEESYQKICDEFAASDKQFQKWRLCLEDALKRLFEIDNGLFKEG